jgi:hypothetical protein
MMGKTIGKTKPSLVPFFKARAKADPVSYIAMTALGLFCLGSIVYFMVIGQYRDCLISFTYMQVIVVVIVLEWLLDVRCSFVYVLIVMVFTLFNLLGASYNFYTYIPILDDILHAFFGFVFTVVGFAIIKAMVGQPDTNKKFFAYLLFGISFALLISVIWEIYEFAGDHISADLDMQEDTIVNGFNSFMLFPGYDHLHTEQINGIAYTVLYDAEGNVLYTIEGGYLDIGLIDTMEDLIWCTSACVVTFLVLTCDRFLGGRLYKWIIPQTIKRDAVEEEVKA